MPATKNQRPDQQQLGAVVAQSLVQSALPHAKTDDCVLLP